MRFCFSLVLCATVLSAPADAAEIKLSGAEIITALSDKTMIADGEIAQIFQSTGLTIYTERGAQSLGKWKVENEKYCSVWPPSTFWSCYDVVRDGEMITFVSSSGDRFPMKLKPAAE
jgi:hypothetical protein